MLSAIFSAMLCSPSVGPALQSSSVAVVLLGMVGNACNLLDGNGSRSARSDHNPPNRTNKTGNRSRSLREPKVSNLASLGHLC